MNHSKESYQSNRQTSIPNGPIHFDVQCSALALFNSQDSLYTDELVFSFIWVQMHRRRPQPTRTLMSRQRYIEARSLSAFED